MEINVLISGDTKVVARFDTFPADLHATLLDRIRSWTDQLFARVVARAPKRTGRLRASTVRRLSEAPTRIRGLVTIDADFAKAGALEYGARRRGKVRGHERTLTQVFGRGIDPVRVAVSPYDRLANIEARLYMRGALASLPEVPAELQLVVEQVARREP